MIGSLKGIPEYIAEDYAVIDVSGVGYQVRMTKPGLEAIGAAQGPVRVFTHLVVRDDEMALFGFLRKAELELFRMLISVTRVGPVLALSILSQISVAEFAAAILGEDEKILTRISGIGQKGARRLILELKDKLQKRALEFEKDMPEGYDPVRRDAVSALVALGFSQRESAAAVMKVLEGKPQGQVAAVVRAALGELR